MQIVGLVIATLVVMVSVYYLNKISELPTKV